MPWKTIRHDVLCMCIGYGACFFLQADKVPPVFAFGILMLTVLLGVALEKIVHQSKRP